MATFLLDTSVLSETSKPRPHPAIVRFLEDAEDVAICAAVVMELQLGITRLCKTDPLRAVKLSAWFTQVTSGQIPVIDTNAAIAGIWGTLSEDDRLRNLAYRKPGAKKWWAGQDLHIAAAALYHRMPIASCNVADFLLIDSCHPLPGVFNPIDGMWHSQRNPLMWPPQNVVRIDARTGLEITSDEALDVRAVAHLQFN